jgi:hypothetical protein
MIAQQFPTTREEQIEHGEVNGEVAPLPKGGEPAAGASSSSVGGSAGVTAPFEDIAKGSALLRPKLEGIPSDERWKQQENVVVNTCGCAQALRGSWLCCGCHPTQLLVVARNGMHSTRSEAQP